MSRTKEERKKEGKGSRRGEARAIWKWERGLNKALLRRWRNLKQSKDFCLLERKS